MWTDHIIPQRDSMLPSGFSNPWWRNNQHKEICKIHILTTLNTTAYCYYPPPIVCKSLSLSVFFIVVIISAILYPTWLLSHGRQCQKHEDLWMNWAISHTGRIGSAWKATNRHWKKELSPPFQIYHGIHGFIFTSLQHVDINVLDELHYSWIKILYVELENISRVFLVCSLAWKAKLTVSKVLVGA